MAFKIIDEGSGFYTVKGVPIFEMHTDRGFACDAAWMASAVQNHALLKAGGYRPTIVVGHNSKNGIEKESVGFLDTLVLKGKRLYADLVRIPKGVKEKIVKNSYPNRSVEILPKSKRILCLALLGGTTPHFTLPQMVYEQNETSEWYPYERNNEMLTEEQKKEIYELVGQAVAEVVPEAIAQVFAADTEDEFEVDADGMVNYTDGETGETYAIPAALAKVLSAGGKAAGKVAGKIAGPRGKAAINKVAGAAGKVAGKTSRAIGRRPRTAVALSGVTGLTAGAHLGAAGQRRETRRQGYAIDENDGTVYFDGEPIGEVFTYEELATTGMKVPTVPKQPANLPVTDEAKPALTISESDVGEDSDEDTRLSSVKPSVESPFIRPVDREDSDQFSDVEEELLSVNYELQHRVDRLETGNALLAQGRRAESYQKWLEDQKAAGVSIGDITQTVEYMMTQEPEAAEKFKQLLLQQPKVAFEKTEEIQKFELADEVRIKADHAAHKETYAAMGVTEKDLQWARYIRVNTGSGEAVTSY